MTIETTEADGQESNGAEAETQAATEEKFTPTVLNEPTATETVETVKTNDEVASTATPTVSPYEDYFKSLSEEDRAKEIKQFEVFKTPSDLAKSYRELQKKFSAGSIKNLYRKIQLLLNWKPIERITIFRPILKSIKKILKTVLFSVKMTNLNWTVLKKRCTKPTRRNRFSKPPWTLISI